MCLLLEMRDGRPKDRYIENAATTNSDGIGCAWREKGYLRFKKGLTVQDAKDFAANAPLGSLLHFRMASVGGVSPKLIHPFKISLDSPLKQQGKANRLLFHNGSWSDWKKSLINHLSARVTLPTDIWSDTRAIAVMTAIHGNDFLESISKFANGYAGKFIVMTPKKNTLIGDFTEDEGVMYSNGGYKWGGSAYYGQQQYHDYMDADYSCSTNDSHTNDEKYYLGQRLQQQYLRQ